MKACLPTISHAFYNLCVAKMDLYKMYKGNIFHDNKHFLPTQTSVAIPQT